MSDLNFLGGVKTQDMIAVLQLARHTCQRLLADVAEGNLDAMRVTVLMKHDGVPPERLITICNQLLDGLTKTLKDEVPTAKAVLQ